MDPAVNCLGRDPPSLSMGEFDPHPTRDLVRRPSLPEPLIDIQPQIEVTQFGDDGTRGDDV